MGLSPKNNKKRKKKKTSFWKSIATGLFPSKGDSKGEIVRKIVFLVALVILVTAVVLIAAHYLQYARLENEAAVGDDGKHNATDAYVFDLKPKRRQNRR